MQIFRRQTFFSFVIMSSQQTVEAEDESEELDPRVQEELEKLNSCTDEINRSV